MIKISTHSEGLSIFFRFIAAVVWMGVIFGFSAQSGTSSAGLSLAICRWIANAIDSVDIFSFLCGWLGTPDVLAEKIHLAVRKAAHVTEYAILGVLLCRFFESIVSGKKVFAFSFLVGFAYACTDELHQLFVFGRGCSFTDILIDGVGVLIGIGSIYFLWRKEIFNIQDHTRNAKQVGFDN